MNSTDEKNEELREMIKIQTAVAVKKIIQARVSTICLIKVILISFDFKLIFFYFKILKSEKKVDQDGDKKISIKEALTAMQSEIFAGN